jgi:adenylate cyclase
MVHKLIGKRSQTPRKDTRRYGRLIYSLIVVLVCLASVGGLTALRIADPFILSTARETPFDLLQRLSPRPYADAPVRIIDIDEVSLGKLGEWPWPRDVLAEFVDRLHAAGAATVAFDFIFAEPDRMSPSQLVNDQRLRNAMGVSDDASLEYLPDNDAAFAEAMRRGYVVIGFGGSPALDMAPPSKAGFAYTGEDPAPYVSRLPGGARVLPELSDAAAGIGSVTLSGELSLGVVRKMPLIWTDGDKLYPSLAAEALRVAQGAQT